MSKTSKVISFIMMVVLVMTMSTVAFAADAATGIEVAGTVYDVPVGTTVTYAVNVTAAELFENVQAIVAYDSTKLELVRKTDNEELTEEELACPVLGEDAIFNADLADAVKFNASKVKGYNFKNGGVLVTLDFVVKDTAFSKIALTIEEMTIKGDGTQSYFTGGQAAITEGISVVETLTFDAPVTEAPTTTVPVTEAPTTTAPVTEAPTTEAPTTESHEATAVPDENGQAPEGEAPDAETLATTVEPTEAATTVPAPATTDATGATQAPATKDEVDTPATGAAAFIYVAIAIMAAAACAVVVLRKKVNG